MLDWLAEQGFDPLTQSALYYALSGEEAPEPQQLQVDVTGAHGAISMRPSRRNALTGRTMASGRIQRMTTRGPLGKRRGHRPTNG